MASDGSVTIEVTLTKDQLEKGLKSLKGTVNKTLPDASSKLSTFSNGFKKIGNIATTAFKATAVGISAVSTAIGGVVAAGAKYNAEIEQYATSFEVMTGSAEKATEVVENLKKLGAETPFEMKDLAETTQLLMNYGLNAEDAQSKLKMLGDISQGSADKMNRIAMAYGQMSSAGKVSLEDVKQMIEAGFNPLQEISQSTGESMSSLYDRISKGTISVDEITASMERSTSAGGKYFQSMEKQSKTVNGQISTLKDNVSQLLGALAGGFSESLAGDILPTLNGMLGELKNAFQIGGIEAFSEKIGEVFAILLTKLAESLPQIVQMGVTILQILLTGIQNNLPQIITSAVQVISTLVQGILQMLPLILQMGMQMLAQLILGIAQMLPNLIPMAIECILTLVETLLDNIDLLIDAAIEFIMGLAEGLITAIPILIEKIPIIIEKLINAIINNLPKLIEMGIELIVKLAYGLVKAIPQLIVALPQIIWAIVNGLAQLPGMMWDIGKNVVMRYLEWNTKLC